MKKKIALITEIIGGLEGQVMFFKDISDELKRQQQHIEMIWL